MACLFVLFLVICVSSLKACPEPMNVLIENYDGPIILHTSNTVNPTLRNHGNHYKQPHQCETGCNCVSKNILPPFYGGFPTSVGIGHCQPNGNELGFCGCNGCEQYYGNNANGWYGQIGQGCPNYGNCQCKGCGYY